MKNKLQSLVLVLALVAGSAQAQLIYTSDNAVISPFSQMAADAPFVANTLLNLGTFTPVPDFDGQIHSFNYLGLTFNNIPNLDPNPPSDLQVGAGFTADIKWLGKDSNDSNTIGSESSLVGLGNQALYTNYGAGSTLTWHITAAAATDLIFWHQDSTTNNIKYTMDDVLHWTTFTASDQNFVYYIFGIDDRGTSLQDFDDGVFGVRINLRPVGLESVPEPSTYGLVAGVVLLALVAFRRIKQRSIAA